MKLASMGIVAVCTIMLTPRAYAQGPNCAAEHNVPVSDSSALAFEGAWATAAAAHDTVALSCMLASDFVDTNWKGVLRTKRDVLAIGPVTPAGLTSKYGDWRVDRHDTIAIVRGMNTVTAANGSTVVARIRFTDVLRYVDGRWQAVAAQETPVQ